MKDMPQERLVLVSSSHYPCFILVCLNIHFCATHITNSMSWRKKTFVIELRTSCPTLNLFRVLLVLGSLLASYASFATGNAQLSDSILKNMTTRVVLDAQMDLTLSHITTSVPGCTTYSFSGHATVLPQRNHLLHDLISCVLCEAFNM